MEFTFKTDSLEEAKHILNALEGSPNAQSEAAKDSLPPQAHGSIVHGISQVDLPPVVPETEEPGAQEPELDAEGMPWDARIHASTKTKKVDGCWKPKRGVSKSLVAEVEAELRGETQPEPASVPVPPAPQPEPAAVPAPPAPPTMQGEARTATFDDIVDEISTLTQQGVDMQEMQRDMLGVSGVANLSELATCSETVLGEVLTTLEGHRQ